MIREKIEKKEIIIDLTGPDGNAFALMGSAKHFAEWLGLDSDKILSEMRSGDYENLIKVFDKYFGDFVILER
jgi:hypothetical protein